MKRGNEKTKKLEELLRDSSVSVTKRQRLYDELIWERYRIDRRKPMSRKVFFASGIPIGILMLVFFAVYMRYVCTPSGFDDGAQMSILSVFMALFVVFAFAEAMSSLIFKTEPSDEMANAHKITAAGIALCSVACVGLIIFMIAERDAINALLSGSAMLVAVIFPAAGAFMLIFSVAFIVLESGKAQKAKFTAHIDELLSRKGMTADELAAAVLVRPLTIEHISKGIYSPSLRLAFDIAKVLDSTVEEVFEYEQQIQYDI